MILARLVQFAVVALALVPGAHANAAPLTYGTYYEDFAPQASCTGTICHVNFSQTPADKLLMVNRITCSSTSDGQPGTYALQISASLNGPQLATRSYDLAATPRQPTAGGAWITQLNETVHFLVGQGRFPYVRVDVSSIKSFTCTLIGDLVTPL
jgi:hypothetical protein